MHAPIHGRLLPARLSQNVLLQDFLRIQQLLGSKALNVNPSKTAFDDDAVNTQAKLTAIQEALLHVVEAKDTHHLFEQVSVASGVELEPDDDETLNLEAQQVEVLLDLLKDERTEEPDAERILEILHNHSASTIEQLPGLISRFPNLAKHIYKVCGKVEDKTALATGFVSMLKDNDQLGEYALFWIAVIAEDYLSSAKPFGDLVIRLYERSGDWELARAKVPKYPYKTSG